MIAASGPTKTMPSRSHRSANSACSATKPHPTHDRVGARLAQRALQRLVVEVAAVERDCLVGVADEHRVALGLRVERDDAIGSGRWTLSSRTAWMTRMAGSPRLTIARRENGRCIAQLPIAARIVASASAPTPPAGSIVR